jgi:hypothetical protein
MKNSIQLIFCFITLLFGSIINGQVQSKSKVKGDGKIVTEKRTTASYNEIKISGFFDVDLIAGNEGSILLEGEQNLLPFIKVEVENNALKIYTANDRSLICSKGKSIRVIIPFEIISQLSLSGSGDIKTKSPIKSDKFVVKLSGSGDINLNITALEVELNLSGSGDVVLVGSAENFISKTSGSGDVNAASLKSKNADISISGSGDYKVYCTESLKARVSGSGDIIYFGEPKKTDNKASGSGEISKG